MARILNQAAGKIVKKYNDLTQDTAGVLTGPLNKLWRPQDDCEQADECRRV